MTQMTEISQGRRDDQDRMFFSRRVPCDASLRLGASAVKET